MKVKSLLFFLAGIFFVSCVSMQDDLIVNSAYEGNALYDKYISRMVSFDGAQFRGELDKVALPILHDASADHTGIPGPFDEHIGDDDILHIDAQQSNHSEHHNLAGEREHHIHHPHDNLLHSSPEVTGHDAQHRP